MATQTMVEMVEQMAETTMAETTMVETTTAETRMVEAGMVEMTMVTGVRLLVNGIEVAPPPLLS